MNAASRVKRSIRRKVRALQFNSFRLRRTSRRSRVAVEPSPL